MLIVRGIEEAGAAAVLQEWECVLIPEVIGPDGLARWDIPELRGRRWEARADVLAAEQEG